MSFLKCKMCGGTVEFEDGAKVGTCDSCGTKQTLPRLDDDRKANLYDRANHFRRNNEYDKAMSIYEQILNEDNTDAESYWSIVLCKYGIEYVEDPATHKRVPTVNRAQFTSVVADEDYKKAIEYADIEQKILYEEEAKTIDEIQKGILEISEKEEPFDVFICYKETDNDGRRTQDSVLANDLYHQLVQEGFKVFFSRITLEDKLGTAYEPYIFAALNSSKVMVALGTKPEYFNAVWVKNEWSRYLALIKSGSKKMLIPAYKDMDPYDLPEEFSHLQAQDMSRLGFMQDLIRGIKKILGEDNTTKAPVATQSVGYTPSNNNEVLLKRGEMALEDKEWDRAYDFYEQVLNNDPECSEAYFGQFLTQVKRNSLDLVTKDYVNDINPDIQEAGESDTEHIDSMIKKYTVPGYLDNNEIRKCYNFDFSYENYSVDDILTHKALLKKNALSSKLLNKALKFASEERRGELEADISRQYQVFDDLIGKTEKTNRENAERVMASYKLFLDRTDKKVKRMYDTACKKRDAVYNNAASVIEGSADEDKLHESIGVLESLKGYKDSKKLIESGLKKIKEINNEKIIAIQRKKHQARNKDIKIAIVTTVICVIFVIIIAVFNMIFAC